MSAAAKLSVVVCSHNGADSLPETLAALQRQTLPRDQLEVIVVDDGSTDPTADLAERAGVRVERLTPNRGIAAARNAGLEFASAPVVAFTDDDCVPGTGWAAELLAALEDETVDGAGGRTVPHADDGLVLRYLGAHNPLAALPADVLEATTPKARLGRYLRDGLAPGREPEEAAPLYSVATANCAFRTGLLRDLGGFDTALRGAEDEDLCRRAHRRPRGARLIYWPRALVRHHYRPEVGDNLRRSAAYGRNTIALAGRHDDVKPIAFPFPLLTAAVLAVAAARRSPTLLALAALVPQAAYPGWTASALRGEGLERLAYPYLQLAEETATMAGELREVAA